MKREKDKGQNPHFPNDQVEIVAKDYRNNETVLKEIEKNIELLNAIESKYSRQLDKILTINSIDNLKRELVNDLIEIINTNYEKNYELTNYRIKKIWIDENKGTPYIGLKVIIDQLKPITIIVGINNTGKTISFEKLFHLFCSYQKEKTSINRLVTKIELILIDDKNKDQEYSIKYHSSFGLDGKRFQISKLILDENGNVKQSLEIQDPEVFLKQHLLIDYNLNETMFVNEIPGETIVSKYCITEEKFRELFRISVINKLFETVRKNLSKVENKIQRTNVFINAYELDISQNKYKLKNIKKDSKKDKLLVDNEIELIQANQEFEKISLKIKEQAEEELTNYRAKRNELAKKNEVLKELEKFNPALLNDKYEALYQTISKYCFECDSIILLEDFKKRVSDDRCYVCGIGEKDYSLEFSVLPENDLTDFINRKNTIIDEIKKLKYEMNEFLINKKDMIPKPENFREEIWKEIQFMANVEEEITSAKERFPSYNIKISTIKQKNIENHNKIVEKQNELIELKTYQDALLLLLNEKLLKYEEDLYKKVKEKIFSIANNILMELSEENIGAIDFDEKGNLVYINSIFKNDDKIEFEDKYINYKDSKRKISQGILRKIDLAFSLAFLFINKEFSIKPLNMLILDSLHNFDNKDINLLLRDLSKKNDYQILIFNTEKPSNLIEKSSKIVEIIRNQLMRKPDTVKHITKQYNLTRFF